MTGAVTLVADLVTKWVVQRYMALGDSIPVIPGVFHLTYVMNAGAAFGMLQNQRTFFLVVSVVAVAVILYFAWQLRQPWGFLPLALGLQLGGALGNFIDRLRYGQVVDFFDFRVWPVFNVADSAISVGVGLLILHLWQEGARERAGRGS